MKTSLRHKQQNDADRRYASGDETAARRWLWRRLPHLPAKVDADACCLNSNVSCGPDSDLTGASLHVRFEPQNQPSQQHLPMSHGLTSKIHAVVERRDLQSLSRAHGGWNPASAR